MKLKAKGGIITEKLIIMCLILLAALCGKAEQNGNRIFVNSDESGLDYKNFQNRGTNPALFASK